MVPAYTSKKKQNARDRAIRRYRSSLVGTALQYWTLAGRCARRGELIYGCELEWALRAGLISKEQWHGVDRNPAIVRRNQKLGYGQWYCGEFRDVLIAQPEKSFNPGLIHYDSLRMPRIGVPYLAKILHLVRNRIDCVVVANFILRTRHFSVGATEIFDRLEEDRYFAEVWRSNNWNVVPDIVEYDGSGPTSCTHMGSVIFYTKRR